MTLQPSQVLLILTAALATFVVLGLAYVQTPYTPRKVERQIKAWLSPATLVAYMMAIIGAALAAMGQ